MLDEKGFDLWSEGYDKSVNLCEQANEYPFAGYKNLLNNIYKLIHTKNNATILDIGFGTGVLTNKLYNDGYSIYGIDFSSKMIEIAKSKMPNATLIQYDFTNGLPQDLNDKKFDYIVSTYAIHHLTDNDKIKFIYELKKHISKTGKILIGDVAFNTRKELLKCKQDNGDDWDNDEYYIVFDEIKLNFPEAVFNKISHCSGIISL